MISIKVTKNTLEKIEKEYKDYITQRDIGYILYVIKTPENIITAYDNKKGNIFKVTIQGNNYLELAKKYSSEVILQHKKEKNNKESLIYIDVDSQIGSDEVGTGDFLGPIVVCAAYCDHETMKLIEQYNIKDSKKFSDSKILEIIPQIKNKVHYECKILSNEKYNRAIEKGFNINKIKCILHNFVLGNLYKKCPYVKNIYMDQFTPSENYYEYLKGTENIVEGIIFKEKGETYFPSVALASCFARYYFLVYMQELSTKYNVKIPLGAGKEVDKFSIKFIEKYGLKELSKIAKTNFTNFKNLN